MKRMRMDEEGRGSDDEVLSQSRERNKKAASAGG